MFDNIINYAKKYFPNLVVKYKDQSILMKIIGLLLFFNKSFMTSFITTLGYTTYFPSIQFIKNNQISSTIILLHELVHMSDTKKYGKLLFSFIYTSPQILAILAIPFLFISWKFSLIFLLCALPIPSIGRAYLEMRAYLISLYAKDKIFKKLNYGLELDANYDYFSLNFTGSAYYYMFPFSYIIKTMFKNGIQKILDGNKPYNDDTIFNMIDDLIDQIKN